MMISGLFTKLTACKLIMSIRIITSLETLLEISQRGYWQANDEQLAELQEKYLKTEGELDLQ